MTTTTVKDIEPINLYRNYRYFLIFASSIAGEFVDHCLRVRQVTHKSDYERFQIPDPPNTAATADTESSHRFDAHRLGSTADSWASPRN